MMFPQFTLAPIGKLEVMNAKLEANNQKEKLVHYMYELFDGLKKGSPQEDTQNLGIVSSHWLF